MYFMGFWYFIIEQTWIFIQLNYIRTDLCYQDLLYSDIEMTCLSYNYPDSWCSASWFPISCSSAPSSCSLQVPRLPSYHFLACSPFSFLTLITLSCRKLVSAAVSGPRTEPFGVYIKTTDSCWCLGVNLWVPHALCCPLSIDLSGLCPRHCSNLVAI